MNHFIVAHYSKKFKKYLLSQQFLRALLHFFHREEERCKISSTRRVPMHRAFKSRPLGWEVAPKMNTDECGPRAA